MNFSEDFVRFFRDFDGIFDNLNLDKWVHFLSCFNRIRVPLILFLKESCWIEEN